MMKRSTLLLGLVLSLCFARVSNAQGKNAGILVVGTQTEVNNILAGTKVHVKFSEVNPSALVAVRMTKGQIKVYEHGAVDDIIKFVGGVVEGGVVFTLKLGSDLWNLLMGLGGQVVDLGEDVLNAVIWVLSNTVAVIKDGVTFAVQVASDVLHFVGDVIGWIIGG